MTTLTPNTQAVRLQMHEWLVIEKDDELVQEVANFARKKSLKAKFSKSMTEDEYVSRVLEATAQAERGEGITVEEFEKIADKW
jgi:hypothetical protein